MLGIFMNRVRTFCFEPPAMPLWRYSLIACPLAMIPSVALLTAVRLSLVAIGTDMSLLLPPKNTPSWVDAFGIIVFSPIVETLLLAGLLALLSVARLRPGWIAVTSAIMFGCFHAIFGVLWFFGVVWSFFVFSCAFLVWRQLSFWQAFLAAALPHALLNSVVMLARVLMQH
jgi:hypothetical protein